jgi:hypothetical protein
MTKNNRYLNSVESIGDTLVVLSNVFFLFASLIAFNNHPKLTIIFIIIAITSTIHHSGWNILLGKNIWGIIDVVVATIGVLLIVIYGLYHFHCNRHLKIFGTQRTFLLMLSSVIISIFAIGMFISAACPHTHKKCHNIQYLIYHSIWHILAGITAMFYSILLTLN